MRLLNCSLFRWTLERAGEVSQLDVQGRLTLDQAAIARTAVLNGTGIGFFIEKDVAEDIAAGRLIRLLDKWTPPRPGFSLFYPGRCNASAGFTAFLAMARDTAAKEAAICR
ncbi:LysR substrate binding domain-containing protein [Paracoccus tibetensis]|uniref:LysR substrate binding domain-containing protein n=1 Tax=Paracoccus tibetensis TaxID=336292 RepID=A0A1G5K107_9RHOB|nr:LysR substrate binding domain-containing protein [Paracoccus tibetensis]